MTADKKFPKDVDEVQKAVNFKIGESWVELMGRRAKALGVNKKTYLLYLIEAESSGLLGAGDGEAVPSKRKKAKKEKEVLLDTDKTVGSLLEDEQDTFVELPSDDADGSEPEAINAKQKSSLSDTEEVSNNEQEVPVFDPSDVPNDQPAEKELAVGHLELGPVFGDVEGDDSDEEEVKSQTEEASTENKGSSTPPRRRTGFYF